MFENISPDPMKQCEARKFAYMHNAYVKKYYVVRKKKTEMEVK